MKLTFGETRMLDDMRRHLAALHTKWQNDPKSDGYHKSSEGSMSITFGLPNWFEANNDAEQYINAKPEIVLVSVYSYLFGPSRVHEFVSVKEAWDAVMQWKY